MKISLKNSLVGKIILGYLSVVALGLVMSAVGVFILNNTQSYDKDITEKYFPSIILLKDQLSAATESQRLTSNWIYQPNKQDKARLNQLHEVEYKTLIQKWDNQIQKYDALGQATDSLSSITKLLTKLSEQQKKITTLLGSDEDYGNDQVVDNCITIFENEATKTHANLDSLLQKQIKGQYDLMNIADDKKKFYSFILRMVFGVTVLFFAIIAVLATYLCLKNISKPIDMLKNQANSMSLGRFDVDFVIKQNDEIGDMVKAMNNIIVGLKKKTLFATRIGEGNYDESFELLSDEDEMGKALLTMKDNLKLNAEEDKIRNWTTHGQAQFGEILRENNASNSNLLDMVLMFIVKYLKANQAALFLLNEDAALKREVLELAACYAYDRKKYLDIKVEIGEGLLGQTVLEREMTYLTDIPEGFVRITSGLGDSGPNAVVIAPIMYNNVVLGVIEIASFTKFASHHLHFVEKVAESLGSTISNIRTNERTKKLLEDSQSFTEQMRSQEEEIRQNMEELLATQEEANRKLTNLEHLLADKETELAILKAPK